MVGGHTTARTGEVKGGVRSVKQIHILQLFHTPQKMPKNCTYWPQCLKAIILTSF